MCCLFKAIYILCLTSSPDLSDALLPMQPSDVLDMPVDPNEPTYCLCHQVSYGEMIGCDNPDVSFLCFVLAILLKSLYDFFSLPLQPVKQPELFFVYWYYFIFHSSVSNWVVSFCLCWSCNKTQRKMVRILISWDVNLELFWGLVFCCF